MTKPPMTLQEAVTSNLEKYFEDLDNTQPGLIYDMVLSAVEKPMLEEDRGSERLALGRVADGILHCGLRQT